MKTVKITKTVPLHDIPREIEDLIHKSMVRMQGVVDTLRNGTTEDYRKILKDIENCRTTMILCDANLDDAYQILLGYMKDELESKVENES